MKDKEVNEWKKEVSYEDIDPHGEEDWDEYEITTGDKLYFFVINDDCTVEAGIGKAKLKKDRLYMKVDIVINQKGGDDYDYPSEIQLNDTIKTTISGNNLSTNKFVLKTGKKYIVAIVNDFKFYDKFGAVQKAIRSNLLKDIRTLRLKIQKYEDDIDQKENSTVELKNKLKSLDQFPDPQYINLKKDQFLVIRSKKEGGNDNINIEIKITNLKIKDGEKGHHLVDDTGNKIVYMKDNYEKLLERGYLLLKSKKTDSNKTYVTKDKELYKQFLKRIVRDVNGILEKNIEGNRKNINSIVVKINNDSATLKKLGENYRNLKVMDLVDKIKEFEK